MDWLEIPKRVENSTHVFHQYTIKIKAGKHIRDLIKTKLSNLGIPTMIYYSIPLHLQKALKNHGNSNESFVVSEALCETILSLPIHTEMNEDMQNYIVDHLINAYK